MFYFDPTYFVLLPAIIISMWAQFRVSSTFSKYSHQSAASGLTGMQVARRILDSNCLTGVRIERVRGNLSDHYDPRTKVLRLSDTVYDKSTIAAIGVAAHECGHAVQDAVDYAPMRWRTAIVPVANFGTYGSWILLLVGIIFGSYNLAMFGVILFTAVVLFNLVTLPVEFNASSRALTALEGGGYLNAGEVNGAGKVLKAAALTYVAALIMAILQLVRLALIAFSARNND